MPVQRRTNWETWTVLILAADISILAFFYCYQHNLILLYGDAEGHINIARRIFDSRTPGPLQLGTVWLPLPHLLMMPFLISDWAWSTAVGGSIPSMVAYVVSALGIFRLVRSSLATAGKFAAWFALLIFAANPSLIYLQATAMTEPLYLALFIWAMVYLTEFTQAIQKDDLPAARRPLLWCAITLAACTLTRYDGWIAMASAVAVVLVIAFRARNSLEAKSLRKPILRFLAISAAGPILWLAYNTAIYQNPLEFANGPYSAKAIEHRIQQACHPGTNDPTLAELYFVHAVEMNLAADINLAKFWLLLAAAGTLVALRRGAWLLLLLWIPLPFYALSIAYSGVPIFVPDWWPFGQYNLRYGLQLLPAVAIFSAAALDFLLASVPRRVQQALAAAAVTLALWTSAHTATNPASFLEANKNMQGRVALQERLAIELAKLPPDAAILMAIRDFPGAPQRAGVPLRRLINENDMPRWRTPGNMKGLWTDALSNPRQFVDYAVGFAGDPVDASATEHHLAVMYSLEVPGQPRATLYRAR